MKVLGSTRLVTLAATLASAGIALLSPSAHAQNAAAAPQSDAGSGDLNEIVVTAQRREERLVNVPISITALSSEKLQDSGVTDMGSLASVVPGLHIDISGAFFQPSIRGVGTAISGTGASANIATYVDGVYKPNALSNDFDFIDVDSIEVLKGPQGTLFGRNATGGAILVNTKGPTFDTQFETKVNYGSFHTVNAAAFASTGFTDVLAGSISVGYTHSEGWVLNTVTDESANKVQDYTLRAKLLFKPNDTFNALLILDGEEINDPSGYAVSAYNGYSNATAFFGVPAVNSGDPRRIANGSPGVHLVVGKGAALKISDDLGFATLNSISSGHWDAGAENTDETAAPNIPNGTLPVQPCPTLAACQYLGTGGFLTINDAGWRDTEKTYSQEINLTHTGGPLDWLVGVYYFWDNSAFDPFYLGLYGPFGPGGAADPTAVPPYPASSYVNTGNVRDATWSGLSESRAVFADLTYDLGTLTSALENFHFTAGGRYDKDEAGVRFRQYASPVGAAIAQTGASTEFDSFVPRGVLRYAPTDNSNVYFSFSKGSKAGLYNDSGFATQSTPVQPEKLTAYEVGYKISTPNTQFEAAAYHYDYRDLQVAVYVGGSAVFQNAPKATINGTEFHLAQRIVGDFRFDAGIAYTHARYTEFDDAALQVFSDTSGVVNSATNVSGKPMERTPTWTGTFGPHYDLPFFDGKLDLDATYSFQTEASFDFASTLTQGGYGLLGVRAGWTDPSKHWNFSVSGRNILNKTYLVQILPNAGGFGSQYGEPANVQVEARYKF
jgi:iron complex outermembrane receptor protein